MTVSSPIHHPADRRRPVANIGRILLGLVVITVGVLFLLDSAGVLNAGDTIGHWWPLAIVALGLLQLAQRPSTLTGSLLLILAGGVLLLFTTDAVQGNAWGYIWPLAVIAAGIVVLRHWRGAGRLPAGVDRDDTIVATGIFGGPSVASASQQFHSASLTAIFGGVTLDLRTATPAPGGATITATAAFGGIDILVPRGWRITTSSTPLFAGVEDKTDTSTQLDDDAPTLHVDALALFGGIEIKHSKH
jgi:predicted membrane protein